MASSYKKTLHIVYDDFPLITDLFFLNFCSMYFISFEEITQSRNSCSAIRQGEESKNRPRLLKKSFKYVMLSVSEASCNHINANHALLLIRSFVAFDSSG
jgi:hypothetical protein